ncbi:CGA/CIA family class A beta-lactamase [Chryseobacterium pennipullorum]|uniref:beta-lactamase n=1 Tax=Chryseobacterium pennipullorum TaxID=2258963 RepID=A0A3D9BAE2_9FLAO|nr:CGA/CIA family class A beta-lactamase [Chryseobacterium pennipullorum]REC50307.1 class A beta-lactamase [Chryseobacterium pennipullorum]
MRKIAFLFLLISTFVLSQKTTLDQKINIITKDKKATVGISVVGFDHHFKYSKNGDLKLPMMSVFKFHIACTALDLVDHGKLSLDQKVFIKKSDLHENTWSPFRDQHPKGNMEASLREVIDYTVALSDNNLCDVLLNLIGGTKAVQQFMNSRGVKNFQIRHNEHDMALKGWDSLYENYSTVNSITEVLKKLHYGKLLSKNSTDDLIQMMLGTKTGMNKLVEQLPKNTPVAHKTGSSGKRDSILTIAENDMGIVTLPNGKQYAIAIFVSNSTETDATNCKIISDISKTVWDDFNK